MQFPQLRGRSLAGVDLRLPGDLPGDTHVLLLAFQQRQQGDIDGWISALQAEDVAGIYELPLLGAKWQPFRPVIDGGMAAGIRVPEVLARTITVYGQIGAVERALQLPSRDRVYAVVESGGQVAHVAQGTVNDEGLSAVLAAVR